MPRQTRKHSRSGMYHIIMRGVNKQNVFEDDKDKQKYIEIIRYYKTISNYQIYAYCLMSNHIHLLIKEQDEPVSKSIQRISSGYVRWYNDKYDRCGHLFQERFKSEAVDDEGYFLTVLRYIHQNPVKAGIVGDLERYPWSSIAEYLRSSVIVDIDYALGMFSADKPNSIFLFREFVHQNNGDQSMEFEDRVRLSDTDIVNILKELGVFNISELQQMDKKMRDDIIKKAKARRGVTIRHLARITGLTKA